MPNQASPYTVQFELPHFIERGRKTVLRAPVYYEGALVAPTGGTFSLRRPGGQVVIDAQPIDSPVSGSIATYTIAADTLAAYSHAPGWMAAWDLDLTGGATVYEENDAILCRKLLHPVISDTDLIKRVPALDPADAGRITTVDNYQAFLDGAWIELNQLIIGTNKRPNLVMSPSSFRQVHQLLTLALIFEDLAAHLSDAYEARAKSYRDQFEAAWGRLNWIEDTNDDGVADDATGRRRTSAQPTVWLVGRS